MIRTAMVAAAAVLLVACGREPPAPAPAAAALARPVLALAHPVAAHELLLIPRAAVVERAGVSGVFVLAEASGAAGATPQARFRLVKLGRMRGEQIEIVSGLAGTETLVLGDLGAVHDGTPIEPNSRSAAPRTPVRGQ